jgi:XTP/dITP diphosphohydrolase
MITLVIATRNSHKAQEIQTVLGTQFNFLTLKDFRHAPVVIEDADSFSGNATKKAVEMARWLSGRGNSPLYVLADDSGLEVDALKGAPGVYSSRFAAFDPGVDGNASDAQNNEKLLRLLKDVPPAQRTARFRCVVALTSTGPGAKENSSPVCYTDEVELQTELFDGVCEGRIALVPRGQGGFGYDPLFILEGTQQSFGELAESEKNQLSHRAKALAKLRRHLLSAGTLPSGYVQGS